MDMSDVVNRERGALCVSTYIRIFGAVRIATGPTGITETASPIRSAQDLSHKAVVRGYSGTWGRSADLV